MGKGPSDPSRAIRKNKKPGETRSLEEFIAQEDPDVKAKWAMSELPDLIDHQEIGQLLNNMHWFVITTEADVPRLLTSDRPLFVSGKFGAPDCYLTLPIAPDRLFVAVHSKDAEAAFRARPQKEVIEATNVRTAERAAKYVYGGDNAASEFVGKHISSAQQPSYFENVRRLRQERQASQAAKNLESP
ncbi:hypothetical protein CWO91_27925 [Bradyrhizobium genosp. SA-3]|nr:hypothetical protein CWO91_27925 [Bradyrhizobium genosp. SA-3]